MNMFKKNGGFTLVELIVVIAILAILAGVAIPAYSGYIKKAQDAKIVTELDAIQTAVQAANATAGEITKITVTPVAATTGENAKPATTTIVVEANSIAAKFGADFNIFYKEGTAAVAENGKSVTVTLKQAMDLTGTSYAAGAVWTSAGWNAK